MYSSEELMLVLWAVSGNGGNLRRRQWRLSGARVLGSTRFGFRGLTPCAGMALSIIGNDFISIDGSIDAFCEPDNYL